MSGQALEALPGDPDTLLRYLNELAGTTGQPGELVISVDGFQQAVRLPPKQAIQLIRISSKAFAAEFADLGRARVDIVTKPGSSEVHADLRGSMSSAAINARNRFATARPDARTQDVSGYDWYYTAGALRIGGLMVVDDTQLWTGATLRDFLCEEPEWAVQREFAKTVVFRKIADGGHSKEWNEQPFVARGTSSARR